MAELVTADIYQCLADADGLIPERCRAADGGLCFPNARALSRLVALSLGGSESMCKFPEAYVAVRDEVAARVAVCAGMCAVGGVELNTCGSTFLPSEAQRPAEPKE